MAKLKVNPAKTPPPPPRAEPLPLHIRKKKLPLGRGWGGGGPRPERHVTLEKLLRTLKAQEEQLKQGAGVGVNTTNRVELRRRIAALEAQLSVRGSA